MMWPPSVLWLAAVVGLALFARAGTGVACSGTLSSASSSSSSSARYWSHVLTYYSVGKVRSCFGEFEVGGALHFFFFFSWDIFREKCEKTTCRIPSRPPAGNVCLWENHLGTLSKVLFVFFFKPRWLCWGSPWRRYVHLFMCFMLSAL